MRRVTPKAVFTLKDVAALAGLSRVKVWEDREAGKLKATRVGLGRWQVDRRSLVDYLVSMDFPLELVRNRLYPGWMLLTLHLEPGFSGTNGFQFEAAGGPFDLGRRLSRVPSWAVLVRLRSFDRQPVIDSMRAYSKRPDRPHLICLDTPSSVDLPKQEPATAVFDISFPNNASPDAVGRLLRRLRREWRPEKRRGN